jgi:hypothetical protein
MVMSPRPGRIVLDEPAVFSGSDEQIEADEIRALPAYSAMLERVRAAIHHDDDRNARAS